jgi:hypothetical protein
MWALLRRTFKRVLGKPVNSLVVWCLEKTMYSTQIQLFRTTFRGLHVESDCNTKRAYRLALGANMTILGRDHKRAMLVISARRVASNDQLAPFYPEHPVAGATKIYCTQHSSYFDHKIPSPWNMRNACSVKTTASARALGVWTPSYVRMQFWIWEPSRSPS